MNIMNKEMGKKRIGSFLLAMGLCFSPARALALSSYNSKGRLIDGREATIYFTTGDNIDDYAFITVDNQVGYVPNSYVNFTTNPNNDYQEQNGVMYTKNNTCLYIEPNMNGLILSYVNINEKVDLVAKSNNGWYVVLYNNLTGFIHESCLQNRINECKVAKITGNNINIRSAPYKDNNIIGFCDKSDKFTILGYSDGWYNIDYLGYNAYVSEQFVREETIDKDDLAFKK